MENTNKIKRIYYSNGQLRSEILHKDRKMIAKIEYSQEKQATSNTQRSYDNKIQVLENISIFEDFLVRKIQNDKFFGMVLEKYEIIDYLDNYLYPKTKLNTEKILEKGIENTILSLYKNIPREKVKEAYKRVFRFNQAFDNIDIILNQQTQKRISPQVRAEQEKAKGRNR